MADDQSYLDFLKKSSKQAKPQPSSANTNASDVKLYVTSESDEPLKPIQFLRDASKATSVPGAMELDQVISADGADIKHAEEIDDVASWIESNITGDETAKKQFIDSLGSSIKIYKANIDHSRSRAYILAIQNGHNLVGYQADIIES